MSSVTEWNNRNWPQSKPIISIGNILGINLFGYNLSYVIRLVENRNVNSKRSHEWRCLFSESENQLQHGLWCANERTDSDMIEIAKEIFTAGKMNVNWTIQFGQNYLVHNRHSSPSQVSCQIWKVSRKKTRFLIDSTANIDLLICEFLGFDELRIIWRSLINSIQLALNGFIF